MKNQKALRSIFGGAVLTSTLMLLVGCGWLGKSGCPSCEPTTAGDSSEVLLTLNGNTAVTKNRLDKFFKAYMKNRPDAMYAQFDPQALTNAFKELEMMEVMDATVKRRKLDQDPVNREKYQEAAQLARYTVNAEILGNEVLDSIDTSAAALEKFYLDNRGKNPVFDNPPFIEQAEGIKLASVEFKDEKSAKDFLAKAQKAGADFAALAKAINKNVNNLGMVTAQSKVDHPIRARAKTIASNAVELVPAAGKFFVVKASGPRQTATYNEYAEVIKVQPALEKQLGDYKKQVEGQKRFLELIEEWKKDLNAQPNTKFFEAEEARKKAELEEQFKKAQAPAAAEGEVTAEAKPAVAAA